MSIFISSNIFEIKETSKYSYKENLSINTILTFKRKKKNYNIKSSTYRRWARTQRNMLNKKGRQAQRNVNYQKICNRPKAIPKHIKLKNKIQKELLYAEKSKNITFRKTPI
jgi:hypothetical protein